MKRRWVLQLLVIGFLWVLVTHFTQAEKLALTMAHGKWQWILAAVVAQFAYFVVFSASYWSAFRTVDVVSRLSELLPVTFASIFVNTVVPSGGTGGAALFVDDAARRGQSASRTTTGVLLQLITDYGAFAGILAVGMIYLFLQHDLKGYEVITALILIAITFILLGILGLGLWRPTWLRWLLTWLQRVANSLADRLKRRPFLANNWAQHTADDFLSADLAILHHPWRLAQTYGLSLAAHGLDILTLFLLFLAFGEPILLGPLVAGYAMGILFWVLSITPQGIGVVEGVMVLVYTSLGVSAEVATTVTLAFRGLSFWLPLVVGFFALRRLKSFSPRESSMAESWGYRLLALLTALMGLVNVFSALLPALSNRMRILEQYSPLYVRHGGRLTVALAGFALLLLAVGLWRRKRLAWGVAIVVLLISALSHLVKGLDYEEALLSIGLAFWLWTARYEFHARSDRPSIRQGLVILLAALIFTLAYGVAGFYLLDRHYKVNFGFGAALRQTVVMFTEFYDPGLEPITGYGRYFADSIYIIAAFTTGYAALMLLRPVVLHLPATPSERQKAQGIVEAFGHSSLARLTLFDDKAYYFSPGGSLVAFAVRQRTGIALGDPIGPKEDASTAILGFRNYCQENDWVPAFYQVLPDYLALYQAAGFELLPIGQEAIVKLDEFNLEGKASKSFRSGYNRLVKAGYSFKVHHPPIPDGLLKELRIISDEWLTTMHGSEKRFSLGWFDDPYIRDCPVAVVVAPEGYITAFANLVTEYQLNEATVDLMRRRREVESGTMDFLFVSLFEWARLQGYDTFNLGLSAFAGVGEKPDDPVIERSMHYVYEHINQFYNFKGLHEFKEKFRPHWSLRYLAYPAAAVLGRVWLAITDADSGTEHFPWGIWKHQ